MGCRCFWSVSACISSWCCLGIEKCCFLVRDKACRVAARESGAGISGQVIINIITRQYQDEGSALSLAGVHRQCPLALLDEQLDDGETDAEAGRSDRSRPIEELE